MSPSYANPLQDSNAPLTFHCSVCGECCSSWNIPIEAPKAEVLLEKDWVRERLDFTRRELVRVDDEVYRLPLTDENVCVFLDENKHCMIEAREGLALKPLECRRFPFATVRMPDGTARHDTSASCKKIAETLLLAFQPILPSEHELTSSPAEAAFPVGSEAMAANGQEQLAQDGSSKNQDIQQSETQETCDTLPVRVKLSRFRQVDWQTYEQLLADFRPIFMESATSEAALKQAQTLIRLVAISKGEAMPATHPSVYPLTHPRIPPDSAEFEGSLIEGSQKGPSAPPYLEPAADSTQTAPKMQLVDREIGFRFPNWAVWGVTLLCLRKPYQTLSWWSLVRGREYDDPRVFGFPVDLRAQRQVAWDTALDRHVNAFLFSLLNRKVMLGRGASLCSLLTMATVACLLVRWYARTLAWMRECATVETDDVTHAIRLVERYYTGHQPRFLQFFARSWRTLLLEKLLLG